MASMTFGNPIGCLGLVLGDVRDMLSLRSPFSKWNFIASMMKSLQLSLVLSRGSDSTLLRRYSWDRRGSLTCSRSWGRCPDLSSVLKFIQEMTLSNTFSSLGTVMVSLAIS